MCDTCDSQRHPAQRGTCHQQPAGAGAVTGTFGVLLLLQILQHDRAPSWYAVKGADA
jgi:hypothetical protein